MKMEIENFTEWTMVDPISYPKEGEIQVPAGHVLPAGKEVMLTHQTPGTTLKGTSGVVSWLLQGDIKVRVVVMWFVPADRSDYHRNKMAVGIMSNGYVMEKDRSLFDEMCEGKRMGNFVRENYAFSSNLVTFESAGICVSGIMGTSCNPTIKISVW